MESKKDQEEKLRESACIGDDDGVRCLIESGVDVNSQNVMNGWSALHWAAKRGQRNIIGRLLQHGASPSIKSNKGELPSDLATDSDIVKMLGGEINGNPVVNDLPITPNYLANPPFPYSTSSGQLPMKNHTSSRSEQTQYTPNPVSTGRHVVASQEEELVLKVRLAGTGDPDYIEVEIPMTSLTYDTVLNVVSKELNVDKRAIQKVRKMPNTIIRKDKDVNRLKDFQEIEIVLTCYATSQHSRNTGGPTPRHIDVVY